ncbi:unnamed protein product [Auanema sp. JU1783]|nr:unnamed protein product [Auanema sp. JU1783]
MSICKENSNDMTEQTCESREIESIFSLISKSNEVPRQCIIMLRKSLGWRNYDEFYLDKNENLQQFEQPQRVTVHSNDSKNNNNPVETQKQVFRDEENKNLQDLIKTKPLKHIVMMPSIRPKDVETRVFSTKHENFVETTTVPANNFVPGLRKFSMKNAANTIALTDKSRNCCEWALNGLCDQNWKKVREMCPVSCGKLSCEVIEGIMTCSRTININVEDCLGSVESNADVTGPILEDSITVNQIDDNDNTPDLSERTYGKFIFF